MPAYDYSCAKCGETFEVWQAMSEDPLTKHPGCGGKVARVFSPVGVAFKGSGFYKTDSGSRSSTAAKKAKASESAGGDSGSSTSPSSNGDSGSSASSSSDTKKSDSSSTKKSDSKSSDSKKSA